MEQIVNKVAESGLITIDLENYYPKEELVEIDLKPFLFMEMILKEKDFREKLDQHPWENYKNKAVAIWCSSDAILPMWAYMLVSSKLSAFTNSVYVGNKKEVIEKIVLKNLQEINASDFTNKRVVVKGCGDVEIPPAAYLEISNKLIPFVKSLMYGEPCSTVPVYKKK